MATCILCFTDIEVSLMAPPVTLTRAASPAVVGGA